MFYFDIFLCNDTHFVLRKMVAWSSSSEENFTSLQISWSFFPHNNQRTNNGGGRFNNDHAILSFQPSRLFVGGGNHHLDQRHFAGTRQMLSNHLCHFSRCNLPKERLGTWGQARLKISLPFSSLSPPKKTFTEFIEILRCENPQKYSKFWMLGAAGGGGHPTNLRWTMTNRVS